MGPQASGIYALYFKGTLVYVGKASKGTTKSKRTLRGRLAEHASKISGRQNITVADMECRYLTFDSEWWVFAAEFALITHYKPIMERKRVRRKTKSTSPVVASPPIRLSMSGELIQNICWASAGYFAIERATVRRPAFMN